MLPSCSPILPFPLPKQPGLVSSPPAHRAPWVQRPRECSRSSPTPPPKRAGKKCSGKRHPAGFGPQIPPQHHGQDPCHQQLPSPWVRAPRAQPLGSAGADAAGAHVSVSSLEPRRAISSNILRQDLHVPVLNLLCLTALWVTAAPAPIPQQDACAGGDAALPSGTPQPALGLRLLPLGPPQQPGDGATSCSCSCPCTVSDPQPPFSSSSP